MGTHSQLPAGRLHNNLKALRLHLGLNQQELARRVGVTRQTISGVESGLYLPSTLVALRLARALGCRVGDLLWLEEETASLDVVPAASVPAGCASRLLLARVGDRWIAHPLSGDQTLRTELLPADAEGHLEPGQPRMSTRLLEDVDTLAHTVALSPDTHRPWRLWARSAERGHAGLRVHWLTANSTTALESLARGEIHVAGTHLYDPDSTEYNVPFVRRIMRDRAAVLITLGIWEEGLVVRPGNPCNVRTVADLAQPGIAIVNREPGSGARQVLEHALHQERIPLTAVHGFDYVVFSHLDVAREVWAGRADAGVSAAAIATAFGLGFVPLQQVRYDIVILKAYLHDPLVEQLLNTLSSHRFRAQLQALGGYDTQHTADIVATLEPGALPGKRGRMGDRHG
jgi:molybdate-binding protein/DNA-binding XRE family transcriptional regulator